MLLDDFRDVVEKNKTKKKQQYRQLKFNIAKTVRTV